jgi:raffinose/stachyose/melibiose transport system permease protein
MTSRTETVLNYFVLLLFTAVVLAPICWTLLAAVSADPTGRATLRDLQWGNFALAFTQGDLGHALLASTVITAGAVTAQVLLALGSGYAFGVLDVVGSKVIFPVVLLGLMLSTEALIIPLYYSFRDLGLTNSWLGLIIIHVGMGVPFGAFWMRATFRAISVSMVEAAQLDGAGTWRTLWSVLVPVSRPAILTLVLLNVMWTWNDYFVALIFISDPVKQPVTLALSAFQGRFATQFNLMSAAAVIICLPVLILYAFFQRQFIRGVMAGALKE